MWPQGIYSVDGSTEEGATDEVDEEEASELVAPELSFPYIVLTTFLLVLNLAIAAALLSLKKFLIACMPYHKERPTPHRLKIGESSRAVTPTWLIAVLTPRNHTRLEKNKGVTTINLRVVFFRQSAISNWPGLGGAPFASNLRRRLLAKYKAGIIRNQLKSPT